MKVFVALALIFVAAQVGAVANWNNLKSANKYVKPVTHESKGFEASSRIVSGTAVAQGQIPWQALLVMDSATICSGVLISSEWVLSVAHCINGHSTFEIVLGGTSKINTQDHTVTQFARQALIHANYNAKTIENDIGLLRLTSLVSYTPYIDAVRLPSLSQISATFEGRSAVISGYGRTSSTSQTSSDVLLQTDVTVIRNDVCAQTFASFIESTNICTTGVNGKGPCERGDSGGPLTFAEEDSQQTLIGLMSFGAQNCPANMPTVYVRVTSYLSWISQNTGLALRP